MSWRDRQGVARFRGVAFRVGTIERAGGRRAQVHDVPFSERAPYTEDLGRKGARFTVEGHVVGADYLDQRDALIAALETEGPGELVHPAHGTKRVAALEFTCRESSTDGGIAVFSIQFVETSAAVNPTTFVDPKSTVTGATETARAAISTQFLADYVRLPAFASSAADALGAVSQAMNGILEAHELGGQQVAALLGPVGDLQTNAAALVDSPANTLAAMTAIFEDLTGALVESLEHPSGVILGLASVALGESPPATTPSRIQERANLAAIGALVARLAIIGATEAIVDEVFDSYEAAVAARTLIADALDAHTEATSDDTFPALQAVRVALVQAVPGTDRDLPHLLDYTPHATVPSLVLAHRLYGDVSLEADVIARNRIRDPASIAGGVALEVLSRG